MSFQQTFLISLLLLAMAILVSMGVRNIKMPYSVGLVLSGLVIAYFHWIEKIELDSDLIFYIFLPPLLFDAGFNSSLTNLKEHWKIIFALAIPGTIVCIVVVGVVAHYAIGIPWMSALLFGAMIAPTDTISILSIFKEMKIPARLATLVHGESLFNDGTAIIIFKLILSLILVEEYNIQNLNYPEFTLMLVLSYAGGLALGGASGLLSGWVMKKIRDHLVEIMFTVLAVFSVYFIAEEISVSGIIAVVTTSLFLGHYRQRMGIAPTTQIALSAFWSFAAFTLNSVLFIMIGVMINVNSLMENFWTLVIAWLAVNLGRVVFIYPFSAIVNMATLRNRSHEPHPIPMKWQHILTLGNLKGSLSMALVMSLPESLIYKNQLATLVFGVVLLSLMIQGTTLRPVLRLFRLYTITDDQIEFDKRHGLIISAKAVLTTLTAEFERGLITSSVYGNLKEQYEFTIENAEQSLNRLQNKNATLADAHLQNTYYQMLILQRTVIQNALQQNIVSEDAAADLLKNFDQQIASISWAHTENP